MTIGIWQTRSAVRRLIWLENNIDLNKIMCGSVQV
jgi:hypothetical protein